MSPTDADEKPLTPLQKVSLLMLNIPQAHRQVLLQCLATNTTPHVEPYTEEVLRACRHVFSSASPAQRIYILGCAAELTDLLERQQTDFEARQFGAQIVGTIPEFLYLARQNALPPIEHRSLETKLVELMNAARHTLDITIPYMSHSGVQILTTGLKRQSRHGLKARILSLLTSPHQQQNNTGIRRLARRLELAGATVEIRTPTDQEALSTGAISVMHAKVIIADQEVGYLGTANISRAGLVRAFEVGVIVRGTLAQNLWRLNDWVYTGHHPWQQQNSKDFTPPMLTSQR